jgi:hypothetical protein
MPVFIDPILHDMVMTDIEKFMDLFDFTRNPGFTFRLLEAQVNAMQQRSGQEQDPNGSPWRSLDEDYAQDKLNMVGFIHPIGVLTGEMLDAFNLFGTSDVTGNQITHYYGLTEEAKYTATAFQEGAAFTGYPNHAARPFFGFGDLSELLLAQVADEQFLSKPR